MMRMVKDRKNALGVDLRGPAGHLDLHVDNWHLVTADVVLPEAQVYIVPASLFNSVFRQSTVHGFDALSCNKLLLCMPAGLTQGASLPKLTWAAAPRIDWARHMPLTPLCRCLTATSSASQVCAPCRSGGWCTHALGRRPVSLHRCIGRCACCLPGTPPTTTSLPCLLQWVTSTQSQCSSRRGSTRSERCCGMMTPRCWKSSRWAAKAGPTCHALQPDPCRRRH